MHNGPAPFVYTRPEHRTLPEPRDASHPRAQWRLQVQEGRRNKAVKLAVKQLTPWWIDCVEARTAKEGPSPSSRSKPPGGAGGSEAALNVHDVLGIPQGASCTEAEAAYLAAVAKERYGEVGVFGQGDGSSFVRLRACYEFLAAARHAAPDSPLDEMPQGAKAPSQEASESSRSLATSLGLHNIFGYNYNLALEMMSRTSSSSRSSPRARSQFSVATLSLL